MNHSMDRREILQILFHPRQSPRTPLPPGARDIDIPAAEGVTLGCRLYGDDKSAPILLFFHGNGEIVSDYDAIGPEYNRVGLNLLVTEFRGYGWSTGTPLASTLLADAELLYDRLRQWLAKEGYGGSLFIFGRSLGSACAIDLAARHNDAIQGLIIDSGFGETLPLARSLGLDLSRFNFTEADTFDNLSKITRVTKPTLILHGRKDQLIPLWQAEKLMAHCSARHKELQVVPGADHNSLIAVGGPLYFQTIKRFVDKVTGADDWRVRRRARRQRRGDDER